MKYRSSKKRFAISRRSFCCIIIITLLCLSFGQSIEAQDGLAVPYSPRLSPKLSLVLAKIDLCTKAGEADNILIPVLCSFSDTGWMKQFDDAARTVSDHLGVAFLTPSEIRRLSKEKSILYIDLGGQVLCRTSDLTSLFEPRGQYAPAAEIMPGNVVVGIIDSNCHLAIQLSRKIASRVIGFWNQAAELADTVGSDGASRNGSQNRFGTHGSVVSSIINRLAHDVNLVVVDGTFEQIDTINALSYIKNVAKKAGKSVLVNISGGMNSGPHDGTSLFEQLVTSFIDDKCAIVVAAGNRLSDRSHVEYDSEDLEDDVLDIEFTIKSAPDKRPVELSLDLWMNCEMLPSVMLVSPHGKIVAELSDPGGYVHASGGKCFCLYLDSCNKINNQTNILAVIKSDSEDEGLSGKWILRLTMPSGYDDFILDGWLASRPVGGACFVNNISHEKTICMPATARKVFAVGAFADQSGKREYLSLGPSRDGRKQPAVFVKSRRGTSYAAALMTGLLARQLTDCRSAQIQEALVGLAAAYSEILPESEHRE